METITKIDVEKEKNKKRDTEYWPSKEIFFNEFPCLEDIPAQYIETAKDLLYSFRHIFFNADRPDQFRQGIRISPIKMYRVPGKVPRKEKVQRLAIVKLKHQQPS